MAWMLKQFLSLKQTHTHVYCNRWWFVSKNRWYTYKSDKEFWINYILDEILLIKLVRFMQDMHTLQVRDSIELAMSTGGQSLISVRIGLVTCWWPWQNWVWQEMAFSTIQKDIHLPRLLVLFKKWAQFVPHGDLLWVRTTNFHTCLFISLTNQSTTIAKAFLWVKVL